MLFEGLTFAQIAVYYYDPIILDELGFAADDYPGFDEWRKRNKIKSASDEHALAMAVYLTWDVIGEVILNLPTPSVDKCL